MDDEPRRPAQRPPDVTSSALILIVLGIFGLFSNAVVLVNADRVREASPALVSAAAAAAIAVSGAEVAAGVMVLRMSNAWRVVGIGIAALGAAFLLVTSLRAGPAIGPLLVTAAYVYVVVALVRTRGAFV
ncbi:MAG TPA: hypothetical protein VG709_07320 [Actinomycetota bacterium]|nr:hypothetical protein [Actinomycetota bacterium]